MTLACLDRITKPVRPRCHRVIYANTFYTRGTTQGSLHFRNALTYKLQILEVIALEDIAQGLLYSIRYPMFSVAYCTPQYVMQLFFVRFPYISLYIYIGVYIKYRASRTITVEYIRETVS